MHLRGVFAAGLTALTLATTGCGGDATDQTTPASGGHKNTGGSTSAGGSDAGLTDAMTGDGAPAAETGAGGAGPTSLCGNSVVDPGEQCDDGNGDNNDGCNSACRFTCQVDDECSDHEFCTGVEQCDGKTHTCLKAPANQPKGTICGQAGKCDGNGVCLPADEQCGDFLVVGHEECDPPDATKGCGLDCRFICVSDDPSRDCTPADECNGQATCNDTTHLCGPRTPKNNFSPCGPTGSKTQCIDGVCSHCGDKVKDPGEECDFGDRTNGDGCEYNCKFTCVASDPTRNCHAVDVCFADGTCNPNTHKCSPIQPAPAGKSCGTGMNCVAGTCVAVACGDGITALGVEPCDDGNLNNLDGCTNKCVPSCVNAATDCKGVPTCDVASCANNVCALSPNASKDGQACSTGGGSGTCDKTTGACTTGVCGDPNVDAGEQCDLGAGNNVHGSGCEPTCLYSCQTDTDCDDGDPCNGVEKCTATAGGPLGTPASKKCTAGAPKLDGDVCAASPRRICLTRNGKIGCSLSVCGDGYTDSATEDCDPPNTLGCDDKCKGKTPCKVDGTWGMKVTVNVSWGDPNGALEPHTGQILQWTMLTLAQKTAGSTDFNATNVKVCGIVIPDFQGATLVGGEWYGLKFANDAIWDGSKMPVFSGLGRVSNLYAGAGIDFDATAILVGVKLNNPSGPWPADVLDLVNNVAGSFQDQDDDGLPGVTLTVKTGSLPAGPPYTTTPPGDGIMTYRYPIVNAGAGTAESYGRAAKIYLGIRALSSEAGTLDTCDTAHGQAAVSSIDNHITGCYLALCADPGCTSPGNEACSDSDWQVADQIKPVYTVTDATFAAQRLSGASPTCATVRTALP